MIRIKLKGFRKLSKLKIGIDIAFVVEKNNNKQYNLGEKEMKKIIICTVLFYLIFGFLVSLPAQESKLESVSFNKISANLYEILGGRGARGGAYIGDDGVLMVDAKMMEESVDQTFDELRKITDKPITYLINTHSDGDHVYGNQFFPPSVTIISHENCRKEFFHKTRDGSPSQWNKSELAPFIPSLTFQKQMNIYLGSKKVELWYFGVGHTTGDIVVYFPEESTAFIGDQIFLNWPQLIHAYKGGNSFRHVKNLTRMLETLDAQHFCSGHSNMTDRNGIKKHIQKIKGYQTKVQNLIESGMSLDEIIKEFKDNEDRLIKTIYNEIKNTANDESKK